MSFLTHNFDVSVSWRRQHAKRRPPRDHEISSRGPAAIQGSAAKEFHGDETKWNPEQLFLASVTQCHMLTFLFLADKAKITVESYSDSATGILVRDPDGIGGEFTQINLNPTMVISGDPQLAEQIESQVRALHDQVEQYCFIRRSIKTPVYQNVTIAWSQVI